MVRTGAEIAIERNVIARVSLPRAHRLEQAFGRMLQPYTGTSTALPSQERIAWLDYRIVECSFGEW